MVDILPVAATAVRLGLPTSFKKLSAVCRTIGAPMLVSANVFWRYVWCGRRQGGGPGRGLWLGCWLWRVHQLPPLVVTLSVDVAAKESKAHSLRRDADSAGGFTDNYPFVGCWHQWQLNVTQCVVVGTQLATSRWSSQALWCRRASSCRSE